MWNSYGYDYEVLGSFCYEMMAGLKSVWMEEEEWFEQSG